jgi:hypothetical protein
MTGRNDDLVARGKAIAESGKYTPPRGEYLGRLEASTLDVYEGSHQQWIDAWLDEQERKSREQD